MQRPALMLLVFNVAAQLISVCVSPLLTRLYTPEQFGVLGAITAIVMTCVPLASGSYELGLPGARNDADAYALIRVCLLAIAFGTTVAAVVACAAAYAGPASVSTLLAGRWGFVPIGIACVALYDMLALEASRQNKLRPLAQSKISQSLAGVGAQLAFGWWGWASIGLLLGFVINQAMGVGRLYRSLVAHHPARGPVSWRRIVSTAVEHRRYPLFASWPQALQSCAKWSLQFAFALLWDPTIAGFIFLTDRVAGRPLLLLSSSLLPVYVAELSQALHSAPGDALRTFYRTLRRQLALTVVWTAAVVGLSPWVVGPLFGTAWIAAVPFMQVMTLAIAPAALLNAVAHTLQITRHQRLDAALSIGSVVFTIAAILGGHLLGWSALQTLIAFAIGQLVFAACTFYSCRRILKRIGAKPGIEATSA